MLAHSLRSRSEDASGDSDVVSRRQEISQSVAEQRWRLPQLATYAPLTDYSHNYSPGWRLYQGQFASVTSLACVSRRSLELWGARCLVEPLRRNDTAFDQVATNSANRGATGGWR